jgi:hypothetical protein
MTMLRYLVLALTAATLVSAALDDALAHHHGYWHRSARHGYGWRWHGYGWGSDPRAARAGYQGPHYGRECYRAASGRWMCPFIHHSL